MDFYIFLFKFFGAITLWWLIMSYFANSEIKIFQLLGKGMLGLFVLAWVLWGLRII